MKLSALAALLILLAVSGCENPTGQRESEDYEDEGTFIRVGHLTRALYDGLGRIFVEDRRISPTSFRGICVRVSLDDRGYRAFYKPPKNVEVEVQRGRLIVHDNNHDLIIYRDQLKNSSIAEEGVIVASLENAEYVLMVLVDD